jgi:hypothetical protein
MAESRHDQETLRSDLDRELDAISLDQALVDFEIANARVVDLTARLLAAEQEIGRLRAELAAVSEVHHDLETRHVAMQQSAAFRLANRVWALRNALRA